MVQGVGVGVERLLSYSVSEFVGHQLHEVVVILRFRFFHFIETLIHKLRHIKLSMLVFPEVFLNRPMLAVFSKSERFYLVIHLNSVLILGVLLQKLLNNIIMGLGVEY